jgi:hypothetical protein
MRCFVQRIRSLFFLFKLVARDVLSARRRNSFLYLWKSLMKGTET